MQKFLDKKEIGIYADPRTDSNQIALGFSNDSALAINMAHMVKANSGIINGNFKKNHTFKAIYPKDTLAFPEGQRQPRSYEKSDTTGVSFGTWAST